MSATDLACPACSAPFSSGAAACPACGIRLVGPDAMRLWEVDQQIAALRREAAGLLESMRSPLPVAATGGPSAPGSDPRPARGARLTGQGLLLGFGALLLLSAVSVFVLVAWSLIGVVGQAVLLTGVTVGAALASRAASTRGLRAAAHTAAVIAIGVSVLMAQGAYSLDVAGLGSLPGSRYAAAAALLLAVLWCGYDALTARSWSPTGRTSAYLPAAVLAVAVAAVSLLVSIEPGGLVLGVGLLVVGGLMLGLAHTAHAGLDTRRRRQPVGVAALLAVASAGLGAAVLVVTAYDLDLGLPERYVAGAVLALLAAPVVSAPAYAAERLGRSDATAAWWTTGARVPAGLLLALGAGTVLLDVPGWGWATASVLAAAGLVVRALASLPAPAARAAALVAPLAAAVVVLVGETGSRSVAELARTGGSAVEVVPVAVEVTLPALWALACLVLLWRTPRTGYARTGLAVGGTASLLLAVVHAPWEASVPAGVAWASVALVTARRSLVAGRSADHAVALLTACFGVVPIIQLLVEGADPLLQAAGAWVLAAGVAWYASAPGRLAVGHLAAGLVSLGHVLLVSRWDGAALEVYTLPAAAAFAVLGLLQHRSTQPAPGTVLTMGPALSIALTPTLLVAVSSDDLLRLALVLAAGIVCLSVGVARGLRAPLLAGAATLGVVAVMQGSPYLAYVPTWLLLGWAGAVLLALGVAWESALGAGRQVGRWVHALR